MVTNVVDGPSACFVAFIRLAQRNAATLGSLALEACVARSALRRERGVLAAVLVAAPRLYALSVTENVVRRRGVGLHPHARLTMLRVSMLRFSAVAVDDDADDDDDDDEHGADTACATTGAKMIAAMGAHLRLLELQFPLSLTRAGGAELRAALDSVRGHMTRLCVVGVRNVEVGVDLGAFPALSELVYTHVPCSCDGHDDELLPRLLRAAPALRALTVIDCGSTTFVNGDGDGGGDGAGDGADGHAAVAVAGTAAAPAAVAAATLAEPVGLLEDLHIGSVELWKQLWTLGPLRAAAPLRAVIDGCCDVSVARDVRALRDDLGAASPTRRLQELRTRSPRSAPIPFAHTVGGMDDVPIDGEHYDGSDYDDAQGGGGDWESDEDVSSWDEDVEGDGE